MLPRVAAPPTLAEGGAVAFPALFPPAQTESMNESPWKTKCSTEPLPPYSK